MSKILLALSLWGGERNFGLLSVCVRDRERHASQFEALIPSENAVDQPIISLKVTHTLQHSPMGRWEARNRHPAMSHTLTQPQTSVQTVRAALQISLGDPQTSFLLTLSVALILSQLPSSVNSRDTVNEPSHCRRSSLNGTEGRNWMDSAEEGEITIFPSPYFGLIRCTVLMCTL